jgi:signal transduction histidine kinase
MSPRVLCIEGNEAIRARLRRLLEREGFSVDETSTGLAGIARARTSPPDLVLADVHLPDIEGFEVAARLKHEKALEKVPVVAVGATPEEHDVALAAGCDGVIDASDDHLSEEVRAYLAGKRERPSDEVERAGLRQLSGSLAARLEAALDEAHRARDRLEELDRLKSAFMHDLAHELSTPLTPLAGYLRILLGEKLGALAPQQRRILEAMAQSVSRLSRIVDNLADFASLGVGEAAIVEGSVDPDALAEEVVAEVRPMARDARIHASVQHGGGGPISADVRKLRQALANLVSNAVKFSPHGGEVLVEVSRGGGKVRFAVYDQGPGVREADAEHIFEPLYHAALRGGDDARQPGSGLGLPVARRIAEAHGGRVYLESPPRTQPGSLTRHFTGSKFVLEIPAERPAERSAAGAAAAPTAG